MTVYYVPVQFEVPVCEYCYYSKYAVVYCYYCRGEIYNP